MYLGGSCAHSAARGFVVAAGIIAAIIGLRAYPAHAQIVANDVTHNTYTDPYEGTSVWFPNATNSGPGGPICEIASSPAMGGAYVERDCVWGIFKHSNYPRGFVDFFTYSACDDASCDIGVATVYGLTSHTYIVVGLDTVITTEQDTPGVWSARDGNYIPSGITPEWIVVLLTQPLHGTATVGTYTPDEGYVGSDYFTYRKYSPNAGFSGTGVVAVRVIPEPKLAPMLLFGSALLEMLRRRKLAPAAAASRAPASCRAPELDIERPRESASGESA